tara:strand:- start:369 stop:485 length:117 start_codon:yes stop_codon:yes gene_type:complete
VLLGQWSGSMLLAACGLELGSRNINKNLFDSKNVKTIA